MSYVPFQQERHLDSSISCKTKFSFKKLIAYYRAATRTRNNRLELLYVTSGVQLHTGYLQDGHLKTMSNSSVHWQGKQYTFIVTQLLNILKLKYIYCLWVYYCKTLKISPRAYILQRPFLTGLFLEGLIFGGAYLLREICISKSIGLAL